MNDLTGHVTGDEYMEVLVARQAAWLEAHPPKPGLRLKFECPPLLEWFVRDEDAQWVQLPEAEPAPKPARKPRAYRSAESLRVAGGDS